MQPANTSEQIGKKKLLCEVIPTYNEADNISVLIESLERIGKSLPYNMLIVIVDDNSSDGTAAIIKTAIGIYGNITLLQRPQPSGIGSAYIDGFIHSLRVFHADYLGEIDADLQHPPEVLSEMCSVAETGKEVIIASRYVKGGGAADWSLGRKIISRTANLLTRVFLRVPVSDATSGFRIMSRRAVEHLLSYQVSSKGYSFQVESLYAYKKGGMSFQEIPYVFQIRKAGKTKLRWKEVVTFAGITIKTGLFGLKKRA